MSAEEAPWWLRDEQPQAQAAHVLPSAPGPALVPLAMPMARVLDNGRYEVVRVLGSGAYATVLLVEQSGSRQPFAIKEALGLHDQERAKRALRELRLLRHFKGHPNIVGIVDAFALGNESSFDGACLVLEPMDSDLARQLMHAPLPVEHRQLFAYQLFRALKAVHSAGVIHRDIKPQNVLISASGELRLCDFGTGRGDVARAASSAASAALRMTTIEAVATAFYRAPDAVLAHAAAVEHASALAAPPLPLDLTLTQAYDSAVDLWGAGCVLAECVLREPLFPGRTSKELLGKIVHVLGCPAPDTLRLFRDSRLLQHVSSLADVKPLTLAARFAGLVSPHELDLLQRLLAFDPRRRLSASQALAHPFFADLHDPEDEPTWAAFIDAESSEDVAEVSATSLAGTASTSTSTSTSTSSEASLASPLTRPLSAAPVSAPAPSVGTERLRRHLWRELQAMRPSQRGPKRNYDL